MDDVTAPRRNPREWHAGDGDPSGHDHVNAAETRVSSAGRGLGIMQVPHYHVENDLAEGRLVELLAEFPPEPSPVRSLYPRSRQLTPRGRAFTEWRRKVFSA